MLSSAPLAFFRGGDGGSPAAARYPPHVGDP